MAKDSDRNDQGPATTVGKTQHITPEQAKALADERDKNLEYERDPKRPSEFDKPKLTIEITPSDIPNAPLWVLFRYGAAPIDVIRVIDSEAIPRRANYNSTEGWIGVNLESADKLSNILHKLADGTERVQLPNGSDRLSTVFEIRPPQPLLLQKARALVDERQLLK